MSDYQAHLAHIQTIFDQALAQSDLEQVLIYSGEQAYGFLDDNAFAFKTNPYFKYWLPLPQQQKSFIRIKTGSKPKLYLFQQEDYWHAQPVVPEGEWQTFFDLEIIDDPNKVFLQYVNVSSQTAVIGDLSQRGDPWPSTQTNPKKLLSYLDYHRAYKTDYEKTNLRTANEIAAKGHLAAKQAFFDGATEFETHLAYLAAIETRESQLPYNNIIAFNDKGSILHYDQYSMTKSEFNATFLIDAGAQYNGYNADISRTYVNQSTAGIERFSAMYDRYKEEFVNLLSEIQLGKSFLEFHDSAHLKIAKLLAEFGVFNCSAEAAYDKGYNQLFFPCGVGHYIGAQVHDVGGYLSSTNADELAKDQRYPFLRLARPIENNIAFTVEPGIYFIDTLLRDHTDNKDFNWAVISELKKFGGFRLEDTVIINDGTAENISAHLVAY